MVKKLLEWFALGLFIVIFILTLIRHGGLIYALINTIIILYSFFESYTSVYFMLVLLIIQYIIALLGKGE